MHTKKNRGWDVVFDLDDVLVPNRIRYTLSKLRCAAMIVEALGDRAPNSAEQISEEILFRNQRIDGELFKTLRRSPDRFPQSWVDTYRELCAERGCEPDSVVQKSIWRAACAFRRGPFRAKPAAIEALRALQADGHRLHLVTVGNIKLQKKKIREAGLATFFVDKESDRIYIAEEDKTPALQVIAQGDPKKVIMVGDSQESDIKPALNVGVHAVWVPIHGEWAAGDGATVDLSSVAVLGSISELPELVRRLVGNGGRKCKCTGKCGQRSSDPAPDSTEQLG